MGTKRDDRLSLPIMLFNEGTDRHRHVSPPVGIADIDHVIVLYCNIALDCGRDRRCTFSGRTDESLSGGL